MAENLISGYQLSDAGSLTAMGITNFLNTEVRGITAPNRIANKAYLTNNIERLKSMKEKAYSLERAAYAKLGVGGLAELQRKIDAINESGLLQLSNSALKRMRLIQDMKSTGPSTKQMEKIIADEFATWFANENTVEGAKLRRILEGHVEQQILEAFEQHLLSKIRDGSGKNIRPPESLIAAARRGKKGSFLGVTLNKKMLRQYKKQITTAFEWEDFGDRIEITAEVEVPDDPLGTGLTSYPYFPWHKMDAELQKNMLSNKAIWHKFKVQVGSCCPKYSREIQDNMEKMGIAAFCTSATSQQDVIGILGELQAMTLLSIISPNAKPAFLGHVENEMGQKIGVDLALESIGFQIKNYKTYGVRGETEGTHLRGEYTLKNFLDKLSESFSPQQLETLQLYYSITMYHLIADPRFEKVYRRYAPINAKLDRLYHGAADAFLPLQIISLPKELADKGQQDVQNAFYFIGGTRLVPVSKILNLYIKYLERLQEGIKEVKIFTTKQSYVGQTYHDEYKARQEGTEYNFVGYDAIANKTKVHYTINLNIDYTLKEMLSYIDQADFYDF